MPRSCAAVCDHLVEIVERRDRRDSLMCGIVGYVGGRPCKELLLTGLERLEYRGYDSAGICLINGQGGHHPAGRQGGRCCAMRSAPSAHPATTGLAHTRWATHGGVIEANAHPIEACEGSGVTVVHNGIIENYASLRRELSAAGHIYHSDTDTEAIAHLVEECYSGDLVEAVHEAYAAPRRPLRLRRRPSRQPRRARGRPARHARSWSASGTARCSWRRPSRRSWPRRAGCSTSSTTRSSSPAPTAPRSSPATAP